MLKVSDTALTGVRLIEPAIFKDERGYFLERWNEQAYAEAGIPLKLAQISHSRSARNAVRGLHYQEPNAQGKLVCVLAGRVHDVAVDIRPGSPTFGRHVGIELTADPPRQLWIPPGFAHGFAVLSQHAELLYALTDNVYSPADDRCIRWDDPDIGISWPVREPLISVKDARGALLKDAVLPPAYA